MVQRREGRGRGRKWNWSGEHIEKGMFNVQNEFIRLHVHVHVHTCIQLL